MTDTPLPRPCRARAYAPGGIGNIGPGLDVLGCAVTGAGDVVEAEWSDAPGSQSVLVIDAGHPELPTDPTRHAAAVAATAVLHAAAAHPARHIALRTTKGLPLAGGQGGSAASAVAGAVAVNALLGAPLDRMTVLAAALDAETRVAGRHADNVAPALLGGIVLVRSVDPLDVVSVASPPELRIVLAQPAQRLRTADARAVLPATVERHLALQQGANIAAMVIAFAAGDFDLLRRALDDRIAEPARAALLPGFAEAKAAALAAGAAGCSISGAGPTAFAFAADDEIAGRVARAMCEGYESRGIAATARIARIDHHGARVEVW
jgi:homoserine kinase